MKLHFVYFSLLWFLPLWAATVSYALWHRTAPRRAIALQGVAALSLILAAAGLQFRDAARKIQLVVAEDVSPSIYELNAQTARVRDLLGALDPETTEAAVVVFSDTAALERGMSPLPSISATPVSSSRSSEASITRIPPWPDFSNLHAVVKMSGTDIVGALQFARGAFTTSDCTRAILLQSDFRDTHKLNARSANPSAAFLCGSGIELLTTPSVLGPSSDVQLAELRVPDFASRGRAVPIDITIASQQPAAVLVRVFRHGLTDKPFLVGSQIVTLEGSAPSAELRKSIRLFDHPDAPGVAIYSATISGPDGPIPGDVLLNNSLSAAVRIDGPSKWAVLARSASTLAKLATDHAQPLGVETQLFSVEHMPADASLYEPFSGILVDGFSGDELADSGAAMRALSGAVQNGKALVAIGGESAFGAGGHPRGGAWENVLPIEMTPEDDRARAVLFVIDVSKSMDDKMLSNGLRVRKMDYAAEQLQAVGTLRPQDRLGLIEFSGGATLAAPLTNEPTHSAFLNAIHAIRTDAKTDFLPALELAKQTLDADNADEKIVILISDGVDTSGRAREDILRAAEKLCPKSLDPSSARTTLWTFGIGVGTESANTTGEELLKELAQIGGGKYAHDFTKLGEQLSKTLEQGKKEFFTRREVFVPKPSQPHPLTQENAAWPSLNFRNRVKTKSDADEILVSGAPSAPGGNKPRSDPLLILSGPNATGLSRRAVLALALDSDAGTQLLAPNSPGRTLLAGILGWAEARGENVAHGISLSAEPFGNDELAIELRAFDATTGEPESNLNPSALLTELQSPGRELKNAETTPLPLRALAPGTYRGTLRAPPATVCRLSVLESKRKLAERFVSTPCAAEIRRFGVDRAAMAELLSQAGPGARAIDSPRELAQWAAEKRSASGFIQLRGWLTALAFALLLLEYGMRGKTAKGL